MDIYYWVMLIGMLVLAFGAQGYVNHKMKKYSQVPLSVPITGAQIASAMLAYHGVEGVPINCGGQDQNFYSPKDNSITLSPDVYNATTITAAAVACHEAGHACQYAQAYTPIKVRGAIFPVVNLCSQAWIWLFFAGAIFQMFGLIWAAIIMYAVTLVFALITLPIEFNASRRAIAYMNAVNLPAYEKKGSFDVLRSCALTYVAAALASALQLLYLLSRARR